MVYTRKLKMKNCNIGSVNESGVAKVNRWNIYIRVGIGQPLLEQL